MHTSVSRPLLQSISTQESSHVILVLGYLHFDQLVQATAPTFISSEAFVEIPDGDVSLISLERICVLLGSITRCHNRYIRQDVLFQLECTEIEVPSIMDLRTRQQPLHNNDANPVQKVKMKMARRQSRKEKSVLPDELILKIVARMGFPSVFKARLLSRAWYFRFPLQSQSVRSLSMSLPYEIMSVSSRWSTYSPVLFGKGQIMGFDRASGGWKQFSLSLSHLPVEEWSLDLDFLTSAGSIMCAITCADMDELRDSRVFVTNVLNKTWKELDLSDGHKTEGWCKCAEYARIFPVGSDSYQVLIIFKACATKSLHGDRKLGSCIVSQLYDSNLRTWSSIKSEPMEPEIWGFFLPNSAYLDGRLYCMCSGERSQDAWQLWVHLVTDRHRFTEDSDTVTDSLDAWVAIPHPFRPGDVIAGGILLCGDKVMVVIWGPDPTWQGEEMEAIAKLAHKFYTPTNVVRIFQIDANSLQLVEVCRGPPRTMFGVGLLDEKSIVGFFVQKIKFASDADYIYFGQTIPGFPMMTYNVHNHQWGCLPPPSYTLGSVFDEFTTMEQFPFAPGLNPFAILL